jgi:hypothetical protein
MRSDLLTGIFLLFSLTAISQITITDSYFPAAGDTLKTAFDGMPSGIVINPSGGSTDQHWDFSTAQGIPRQTIYRPASAGSANAEFPTANLVVLFEPANETYYKKSATTFELVGYEGLDPASIGINLTVHLNPTLIERRAPLNFIDFATSATNVLLPFAADEIPEEILDQLPITPDSIRLRIAIDRTTIVDGWGTATIPGGVYEVLREKQIEMRETLMDVKIGPLIGWIDVTDELPFDFLGKDTITAYHFYSNDEKEAIANVFVDNENNNIVNSIEYKDNGVTSSIRYVSNGKPDMIAYPNPAIEDVRFEFFNLPSAVYTLKIYNILGVVVWEKKYALSGNRSEKIDLSNLRKGTYLYSLTNDNGKIISTKRLLIMRP